MAETPNELTEKLKALGNKPTSSFVAPVTTDSVSDVPVLTGDSVTLVDSDNLVEEKPLTIKDPIVATNEQMENLIDAAKESNQTLNNKVIDFDSQPVRVKQILKDCGMDTQMVERAYQLLKELN